jgi:DNA-binding response OmpR family regulator
MAKRSILIVEDEALITLQIMEILTYAGYDVIDAVTRGEEVLEKISGSCPPDLILMDIGLMGKLDGIETARAIRGKSEVPIIFITAYGNGKTMSDIRNISCSSYIPKPFEDESILEAIRKFETE